MKKQILSKTEAVNNALKGMIDGYKLQNSESLLETNTNKIIKTLTNLYRVAYVYTFRLNVTDKTKDFNFSGQAEKIVESDNGGIYKVWFDKDDITLNFTPTTLDFSVAANTLTQNQYMYIYSNCQLDFPDDSSGTGYSWFYYRNEHLSYYKLSITGKGYVLFRGVKNSINEIGYDDDYQSESDFANNLFKVTFDYDGKLTLAVYHDNPNDDIEILESSNCTVGERQKRY